MTVENEYDPLHTMLALNMAITSIHRIINSHDRIILNQEYTTIINNIAVAHIKADEELMAADSRRFTGQYGISPDTLYPDPEKHILAFDLIYSCQTHGLYDGGKMMVSRGMTNGAKPRIPRINNPCELIILELEPE